MSKTSENFKSCCKCARDGLGGAALSHAGCFIAPAVAGAFGGSISGAFMAAAMYVTSPLIAMGVTYCIDRLRGQKTSLTKLFGSAAIALVVAVGINHVMGHDHGDHEHHHDHGAPTEKVNPHKGHHMHGSLTSPSVQAQAWLDGLDPAKRREIEDNAARIGISTGEYLNGMCGLPRPPLRQAENRLQ